MGQDLGPTPELRWVSLDDILIDRKYQRALNEEHANRIAQNFDWRYFQPPSLTPADERYKALDGQHRIEGAKRTKQIDDIPAYVTAPLDAAGQAKAFLELNTSQRPVTPVDRYHAGLEAQIPEYQQLKGILENTALDIVPYVGFKGENMISSVTTLLRSLRRDGEDALERALTVLKEARPGDKDAFPGNFISAVSRLCREGAKQETLTRVLSIHDYQDLKVQAYRLREEEGGSTPIALQKTIRALYTPPARTNGEGTGINA